MKRRLMMAAAVAALLAGAGAAGAQQKPPIKLAHTAPLSGILAQVGQLQAMAVDIGAEHVNAAGGVNGSRIEIMHLDDQLKPDQAVLRIREAIAAGAVGIIGPASGTQWEMASPLVNQLKFPAININANKPNITVRPWSLRLANTDDTGMPEALDDFLKHYPAVKKVVVLGDVREASGKAAVELWTELAKSKNIEVVGAVTYTTGTTDFSPMAIKVKELAPDAILNSSVAPDALRIGRELQVQGVKIPILGNSLLWPGTLPQSLSKTVGADAGFWHTTGYSTNLESTGDPASYATFVKEYSERALQDPTMAQFKPPNVANASLGYDAVAIVAKILNDKKVDGATPVAAQREALMQGMVALKDYVGMNHYKIRDNGDAYIPTKAVRIDPDRAMWVYMP